MKKTSTLFIMLLLSVAALTAQTKYRLDGVIYELYSPIGGTPYAIATDNILNIDTYLKMPDAIVKDGVSYPITTIGKSAFESCVHLNTIELSNSVKIIEPYAFRYCNKLSNVTLSNTLETIGNYAFYDCENLTDITFPNSITAIGDCTFGSSGLVEVQLPNSLINMGIAIFSYCTNLEKASLPNSIKSIPNSIFSSCVNLVNVFIPESVTDIGYGAFYFCTLSADFKLPSKLKTIGSQAFQACKELETIEIPTTVTSIEYMAFEGCKNLTSISIPSTLKSMGGYVFYGCNLKEVYYNTTEPKEFDSNIFNNSTYNSATLYVPNGVVEKCYSVSPWIYFLDIQEKDFAGIDDVMADVDPDMPVAVYTLGGIKVSDSTDNLPAGLYIVRQGAKAKKISVNY